MRVIEDVTFALGHGSTLGIVGESGSGKSVTAQSIMRILPSPPARLEEGRIVFEGVDLTSLPEAAMRKLRGDRLAMIFQEPMTSLNPTMTVGAQIAEALELHRRVGRTGSGRRVLEMLRQVGIGAPDRRAAQYPHQLSGGLRQRVMIAMALVCGPKLLIADEPTTALDVTIQAQILALLAKLQRDLGLAILLITHDLDVIAEVAPRRRGHVRRTHRRKRAHGRCSGAAPASVYGGSHRLFAAPRPQGREVAGDPGAGAAARPAPHRLQLCRPVQSAPRNVAGCRTRRSKRWPISAGPPAGIPCRDPASRGPRPRQALPVARRQGLGAGRRRRQHLGRPAARPWASSVNRAAANPRSARLLLRLIDPDFRSAFDLPART